MAMIGLAACGSRAAKPASNETRTGIVNPVQENPVDAQCLETNRSHPIGRSIAESYTVSYEQVITWFCSGYSFDNIMIALETGEAMDIPPETLLKMLLEREWDEIWDEIGFIRSE